MPMPLFFCPTKVPNNQYNIITWY